MLQPWACRLHLCVLRESVAMLKTLLCDSSSNQEAAVQGGLVETLVMLLEDGDMGLAWQAAEAVAYLGVSYCRPLLAAGAVEALCGLLNESSSLLHELTLRKHQRTGAPAGVPLHSHSSLSRDRVGWNASTAWNSPPLVSLVHLSLDSPRDSGASSAGRGGGPGSGTLHRARRDGWVGWRRFEGLAGLHLVGKLQLQFTTSSCLYHSHEASVFCDYCVPSSVMKGLLRLANTQAAQVAERLVAADGLQGLLQLLQHEAAGVHHSRLASSILTLLTTLLCSTPAVQDEMRSEGGLGVLCDLLSTLLRPGVTDIYQLRVCMCVTLKEVLAGNQANKLIARELGLFPLLLQLLHGATSGSDARGSNLLEDSAQLSVAALHALAAATIDSPGNQEELLRLGATGVVGKILASAHDQELLLASLSAVGALVDKNLRAQGEMLAGGLMGLLMRNLEQGGFSPEGPVVSAVVFTLCQLLDGNPAAKATAGNAGAVGALIRLLGSRPCGSHTSLAAAALQMMAQEDVDLQNEIAAQGCLRAAGQLFFPRGPISLLALELCAALVRGNNFVKNSARECGVLTLLLTTLSAAGIQDMAAASSACITLCEVVSSNHANQDAVAEAGGVDAVLQLLRCCTDEDVLAAAPYAELLPSLFQLMGALAEFNSGIKTYLRESGGLTLLADFVTQSAEVPDLHTLEKLSLLPTVAAAMEAVAALAQDSEPNTRRFMGHGDCASALFRLLTVDDVGVACAAAAALEHVAIRSDMHDANEDRSDFEADAIRSMVKILHSRGDAPSPYHPHHASLTRTPHYHQLAHPSAHTAASATNGSQPGTGSLDRNSSSRASCGRASDGSGGGGIGRSSGGGAGSRAGSGGGSSRYSGSSPAVDGMSSTVVREASNVLLQIVAAAEAAVLPVLSAPSTAADSSSAVLARNSTTASPQGRTNSTITTNTTAAAAAAAAATTAASNASSSSAAPAPRRGLFGLLGRKAVAASLARTILEGREMDVVSPASGQRQGSLGSNGGGGSLSMASITSTHGSRESLRESDAGSLSRHHSSGGISSQGLLPSFGQSIGKSFPQAAASFRTVPPHISPGPWAALKTQLAWLLYLLAVRSRSNRELLSQLQRTSVAPLAQQLANAEACVATLALMEAESAAAERRRSALAAATLSLPPSGVLPVSISAREGLNAGTTLPAYHHNSHHSRNTTTNTTTTNSNNTTRNDSSASRASPGPPTHPAPSPHPSLHRLSPHLHGHHGSSYSPHPTSSYSQDLELDSGAGSRADSLTSGSTPFADRLSASILQQQQQQQQSGWRGGGGGGSPLGGAAPGTEAGEGGALGHVTSEDEELAMLQQEVALVGGARHRG
ncbi:MAG: hypothetical protein WDW38_011232 [Sanguina aurantia]